MESTVPTHQIELYEGTKHSRIVAINEYGDPNGWPVLLCPPLSGNRLFGKLFDQAGKEARIRIICADRPGFGYSHPYRGRTFCTFAHDVKEFMKILNIDKFSIIGHSAGGLYAAAVAVLLPQQVLSLTLITPFAPIDTPGYRKLYGMIKHFGWLFPYYAKKSEESANNFLRKYEQKRIQWELQNQENDPIPGTLSEPSCQTEIFFEDDDDDQDEENEILESGGMRRSFSMPLKNSSYFPSMKRMMKSTSNQLKSTLASILGFRKATHAACYKEKEIMKQRSHWALCYDSCKETYRQGHQALLTELNLCLTKGTEKEVLGFCFEDITDIPVYIYVADKDNLTPPCIGYRIANTMKRGCDVKIHEFNDHTHLLCIVPEVSQKVLTDLNQHLPTHQKNGMELKTLSKLLEGSNLTYTTKSIKPISCESGYFGKSKRFHIMDTFRRTSIDLQRYRYKPIDKPLANRQYHINELESESSVYDRSRNSFTAVSSLYVSIPAYAQYTQVHLSSPTA